MAKSVIKMRESVEVPLTRSEAFALFADPDALIRRLGAGAVTVRKLPNAERWVMSYPKKLGDKLIDLRLKDAQPPTALTWIASLRGFEIETEMQFSEPDVSTKTKLQVNSHVRANSLRAKLIAPVLKLGERRIRKGLRKGLRDVASAI